MIVRQIGGIRYNYTLTLLIVFLSVMSLSAQTAKEIIADNVQFRAHLNLEYADSTNSPLTKEDRDNFKELPFFPIDTNFRVIARFERVLNAKPFEMETTTSRRPVYEVYGVAHFELLGKPYKLNIYQSHQLRETDKYRKYLFLPYSDESNGGETYGGGRFIDLEIPNDDFIVIDFNKSYNPYCAYNAKYSCPIPPQENFIDIPMLVGVADPPIKK